MVESRFIDGACLAYVQSAVSPRATDPLNTMNWRLVDEDDIYWIDELVPTPTREVLQSEPSEAVKNYLNDELERCRQRLLASSTTNTSSRRRFPPCPCVSPDLRTSSTRYCK